ncbi:Transcriptional regulatory protein YycF [Serratia liquefaciens]|nr:Transcriptional regulatory protein YycF [Serratia liquefaciens]
MKPAILIVDDDPAICDLLCDVLNEHVFTVHACHRGSEALTLLSQQPDIALVLLDLILPDTNGLLVLQQIHRLRPDLPVVMLTGLGAESDVVVGLEMGADDYIAKPFIHAWWSLAPRRFCAVPVRWRWNLPLSARPERRAGSSTAGVWTPTAARCTTLSARLSI